MLPQDEGDEPKALNLMTAVTERFPEHAGALNFVGYALAEKGERLDEAEALIRRALKHEPDDGAIIDSLGWVLFKRGALADAETELRHAVTLLPQEGELQFHLGEVLAARGDKAGAIEAMTKALLLAQTGGDASEADVRANIRKWKSRLERVRKGKLK